MAEHEEKKAKHMKKEEDGSWAHWVSLRATYRVKTSTKEETDGEKKMRERKKFRGFFLRHGMLLRENIRR